MKVYVDKKLSGEIGTAIPSIKAQDDQRFNDQGSMFNNNWYNLSGQRLNAPTQKGVYIKGGKKVLR
jgi:hypothetical protein